MYAGMLARLLQLPRQSPAGWRIPSRGCSPVGPLFGILLVLQAYLRFLRYFDHPAFRMFNGQFDPQYISLVGSNLLHTRIIRPSTKAFTPTKSVRLS